MTVVKQSRFPYEETQSRLLRSIAEAGQTVFAMIDQTEAAVQAGLALRPTSLIVFGNPKGGTLLMDAFPIVALALPLKLLVWQEGTSVNVAYDSMSDIAVRHGVTGKDALIAAMDANLSTLSDSVV